MTVAVAYVPGRTFAHRAHPSTIFVFELLVLVVAWQISSPWLLGTLLAGAVALVWVIGVPPVQQQYLIPVAIVVAVFVFTQGIWFTSFGTLAGSSGTVLFHLWPEWMPGGPRVPFVAEGMWYGLSLGLRFAVIAAAFPVLIMTTHPGDLVAALSRIRVGQRRVPDSLVFVLTTALRYVPTMTRRFAETRDAQRARGIVTDSRNPIRRFSQTISLLLPVFMSSLIKAQELTLVLETRGFGAVDRRSCVRAVPFRRSDGVACVLMVVIAACAVVFLPRWPSAHLSFAP